VDRLLALHRFERHVGEQIELLYDFIALCLLICSVLREIDWADPLVLLQDLVWLLNQQSLSLLLQQVT